MLQYLNVKEYVIPDFIKEYIQKCTQTDKHSKNGKLNGKRLKLYLTPEISEWQSQNNNIPFTVVKKMLITGDFKHPVCETCGKILPIEKYGYKFCSNSCMGKSEEIQKIKKQTWIEKYGVENPLQNKDIIEKAKQTNLQKYGKTSFTQTDEYKEKTKQIWKNKTKNDIELIQDKRKKTCIELYGVEYTSQIPESREKAKQTFIKRYGCENPQQNKEIQNKTKQTNLEKYGCEWTLQAKEVREKTSITFRKRYYDKFVKLLAEKHIELLTSYDDYINLEQVLTYKCSKCGTVFESERSNPQTIYCEQCHINNIGRSSNEELELLEWMKSIYTGNIIENNRKVLNGKELDIYIPDKRLAIEYNGSHWHILKEKNYHQEKSLDCLKQGIRLIHIFDYEWKDKKNICKSIIQSALGIYDKRIYARKCIVKEISSNDYIDFLDFNHLQGSINSSIRYGLYYNDELVSVIGFGKSRFKKDEMELHRFCSKLNYQVIGGFSKLIKHSGIDNFITYVDLSHFSGDGYKKIGFKEISVTEPNYKWIKDHKAINRFQTQKHKLEKLLGEDFNAEYSETENMLLNGYEKLYDSGNLKLIYNY